MKKIIPLLFTAVAVGCASSELPRNTPVEAVKDTTTVEAKYAANELGAREVAEVRFAHGSNRLDAKSAKKIRQALQSASKLGKIEEVKVISWADREFPSIHAGTLPEPQRDLADARNRAVKAAIERQSKAVDVDEYNMAVYPNSVERLFKTSDYRVKRSLEESGIPNSDSNVKAPAMAGKSIVMILVEPKKSETRIQ